MTGKMGKTRKTIVALALLSFPPAALAAGSGGSGGLGTGVHDAVPYEETEFWLYVPDAYTDAEPWPLVVFLHGDEGDPRAAFISIMPPYWQSNQAAILVAPRAPFAGGSWWNDNPGHDVWMTALVDFMLGQYNVELDRITIGGWSGGATFSAYHAMGQQERYAGVHFISGSNWWGIDSAPADCPIIARWTIGSEDFLYDGARALYDRMTADGAATTSSGTRSRASRTSCRTSRSTATPTTGWRRRCTGARPGRTPTRTWTPTRTRTSTPTRTQTQTRTPMPTRMRTTDSSTGTVATTSSRRAPAGVPPRGRSHRPRRGSSPPASSSPGSAGGKDPLEDNVPIWASRREPSRSPRRRGRRRRTRRTSRRRRREGPAQAADRRPDRCIIFERVLSSTLG